MVCQSRQILLGLFINILLFAGNYNCCKILNGIYDLSRLKGVWSIVDRQHPAQRYDISLCNPLKYENTECANSSVCVTSNGTSSTNLGTYMPELLAVENVGGSGFSIFFVSEKSCGNSNTFRSLITFTCGQHLGSPSLALFGNCQAYFHWKTSAACKVPPKRKEVPCYTFDKSDNKIDLTPLIKSNGAYNVASSSHESTFFINICSDILPDQSSAKCPNGSAACKVTGKDAVSYGSLTSGLQHTEDGVVLIYEDDSSSNLCTRRTRILFRCPSRLQNRPPLVIFSSPCLIEIEWETEYACPENILKGDPTTCKFTEEDHGIDIDLSPLKKDDGYNVTGYTRYENGYLNRSSEPMQFFINICGSLNPTFCKRNGVKFISACMFNKTADSYDIIGTKLGHDLNFADSTLTLTYERPSACDGDIQGGTIINFICSRDGELGPQHMWSDSCTHVFEWRTIHACVKSPLNLSCVIMKGEKIIDLGRLSRPEGDSWLVKDDRSTRDVNAVYFMDICKQNVTACQDGAAVCRIDGHGQHLNLGRFVSAPTYNTLTDSVILQYSSGDTCKGNLSWSTTVNFKCKPGYLWNAPFISNIDNETCHYEINWHSAEVCPLESLKGSSCKIYSADLGLNFDLSPLKSVVYEAESENYRYQISICGPIFNASCTMNNTGNAASVCQIKKDKTTTEAIVVGEANDKLSYENGIIYLLYPHENGNTTIIFMCDHNAGRGKPIFIQDQNGSLVFHWFTDLACSQNMAVDCTAHDPKTNEVYDLSSLTQSASNWVVFHNDSGMLRKSYINVCRALVPVANCERNTASCIVNTLDNKELSFISDAGRAIVGPEISSDDHLQLNYSSGNPCVAFGKNTTYTTLIHFLCSKDLHHEKGPRFLGRIGMCQYTYLWITPAACPTGEILVTDKCYLTDPETGYTFDLTQLQNDRKPYTVSAGNKTYQLNVCGPVEGGCLNGKNEVAVNNVSVCEVTQDGHFVSALAVSDSHTLHYSREAGLHLTYKHANSSRPGYLSEVVISFTCSNSTLTSEPKLLQQEGNQYVFEIKTPIACPSNPFVCNFEDNKGREYDLSPLSMMNGFNWIASDTREGYGHLRYHVSFCQPLNRISTYKCPGGTVAACQISVNGTTSAGISLGTQVSAPIVSEDGVITIIYANGAQCENKVIKSSARINLFCSAKQGSLMFIGETPECEFLFSLNTPAACPLQTSRGFNCTVREPMFGYTFDLSPLKSSMTVISLGEFNYSIAVCQPLKDIPGKCAGAAACQTKPRDPKFAKSLGLPESDLMYDQGIITLKYENGSGSCHNQYNRSTVIKFVCDHNAVQEGIGKPFFVSETEDCNYLFTWPTAYACPPFNSIECSVEDDEGYMYDLSHLSYSHDNYYITMPAMQNRTFVINVCRSVVHTPDSLCPYSSAVCLINSTKRVLNLGQAERGPYFHNGKLRLKYTSGELCDLAGSSTKFMETIIDFSCDRRKVFSEPEYVGNDGCTYYFDWDTAYACREDKLVSNNNCTVSDPTTGYLFNLTSLKTHDPYQITSNNHIFHLSVCSPIPGSPCGLSGVCQEEVNGAKRHFNAGKPNGVLKLNNDVLYLNYTNGDSCHNGLYQRSTIIQFHCGKDVGKPSFLYESDDCTYYFIWHTELACQLLVHCAVSNGTDHFDLSSLSALSYRMAESTVYNEDSKFYINVCGPLGVIPGVACPPSSSICRVTKNGDVESLGRIGLSPFIDFSGFVTAIYTDGSECSYQPGEKKRSRIIFECDPNELEGEPVLIEINEEYCLYVFHWRTSAVCSSKTVQEPIDEQSCIYKDIGRGIYFDISPLRRVGSYYEVKGENNEGTYLLNVCGTVNSSKLQQCAGSSVCYQNNNLVQNYGLMSTQELAYDGHRLRMTFSNGDSCIGGNGGKRTSEIFLTCDPDGGIGMPTFYRKFPCLVVLMWETNLVCRNLEHQCAFNVDGNLYDLYLLSSLSHNWNTTDKNGNVFWLNLCRGIQQNEETMGCPPSSAICMRDPSGSHMPLGMVHSMKTKNTNSSGLILTYESHNSQPCPHTTMPIEMNATTRIFLTCGNTLGSPKLMSGPDARCYYDFIWKTSLACPVKMEEVFLNESGILFEKDLNYEMDLTPIFHRTFEVLGTSGSDSYTYLINLNGMYKNDSQHDNLCANAAVCQTKPGQSFQRDIGSANTMKFYKRGSQLHLIMTSLERSCGKNKNRNVTTIINLECSTASDSVGTPKFLYESAGCDYLFDWGTYVVCSTFHRPDKKNSTKNSDNIDHVHDGSSAAPSHKTGIVIGILFLVCIVIYTIFVLSKAERRAAVASKFRACFSSVSLPQFQYKRWVGEDVSLVGDLQPKSLYEASEDENVLL